MKKSKSKVKAGYIVSMIAVVVIAIIGAIVGGKVQVNVTGEGFSAEIQYAEEQVPAVVEDDLGEYIEINEIQGEEIKTVEEVDGGLFEDIYTGLSSSLTTDVYYNDLGWSETYNVSSPEAFRNDTIGKCIIANNRYGAQCVSLARVFWWSYANRDVSTCGTGMAKGMMNCAEQNAGNDFNIYWAGDKHQIQAGDWLVFEGGLYGHVGMALGPVVNGYAALLGENQGGAYCTGGGAATNIINKSTNDLIGFYRPKAYIKPEPTPTPEPTPVIDQCKVWNVKKGDTLGKIMKTCKGKITWGDAMNDYASHWYSTKFKKSLTVYDGWLSKNGVGLFAGDTIEWRGE